MDVDYPKNDNNRHFSPDEIDDAENLAARILLDRSESHDARRLAAFVTLAEQKFRRMAAN